MFETPEDYNPDSDDFDEDEIIHPIGPEFIDEDEGDPVQRLRDEIMDDHDPKKYGAYRISRNAECEGLTNNIVEIIRVIGEDPSREGLQDTPDRVLRSWDELYAGYQMSPEDILTTFDKESYSEMVLLSGFNYYSMCEHHMLPFYGKAHVGYIPSERIVGLSKLSRLVEIFARRLQNQERLTSQIADTLQTYLNPIGVAVVLEGRHFCMCSRGVRNSGVMVTSSMIGSLRDDPASRAEFLSLIQPYRGF